jgi:cell division septation protein DedD
LTGKPGSAVDPRKVPMPGPKGYPGAPSKGALRPAASSDDVGTPPVAKRFVFFDQKNAGKLYTIQLVTHKKKEQAENEVRAVRKSGFYSFIIPSGEFYQVCVGQYGSHNDAKKDLAFFKSRYQDCYLRRR